uniref:Ribosomal RNA small subunit methyltransferase NEP-1 n=1 Tax=Tanacetum cinerariifolium TaxID=118510 RepID=A0A699RNR7_TANCI|nr:ribosomal RNA small subunit methyltransferase NEP-1 [Tanacetum cinerariifolium]
MVRPYAIKGRKRKKNKTERYHKEEDEEENVGFVEEEEQQEENVENDGAHKKLKGGATESDEAIAEAAAQELAGIPVNLNEQSHDKNSGGVIFILEKASLEVAKVGKVSFVVV